MQPVQKLVDGLRGSIANNETQLAKLGLHRPPAGELIVA
jgi:hypothetical protein